MSAVTAVPEVMAGCRNGSGGYRVDARRSAPDGGAGDLAVLPAAAGEVSTAVAQVFQLRAGVSVGGGAGIGVP